MEVLDFMDSEDIPIDLFNIVYSMDSTDSHNNTNDPWQSSVDNLASMGKCLLTQSEFSDVTFKVGKNGQTENINGHRVLMAGRSSVFARMFFGSLPENKSFIEVTDTEPAHFKLVLEFLYTDHTAGLDADNVLEVYKLAHKYDIAPLKKFCAEKVEDFISMEKLGQYLDAKELYEDPVMDQHINAFVAANAWKLFQKEEYYRELTHWQLMYIWERDQKPEGPYKLREVDIFKGALTWAKAECERQGLPSDDANNQREVLDGALDLIRFPRMTLKEFYGIATQGGILTWEERDQMTLYLVNAEGSELPFGRPAPQQASKEDRVRLPDGRIVGIERDLLQDAIAKKRYVPPVTCGCNCTSKPSKQCKKAEARCRRIAAPLRKHKVYRSGDWSTQKGVMYKARRVAGNISWFEA